MSYHSGRKYGKVTLLILLAIASPVAYLSVAAEEFEDMTPREQLCEAIRFTDFVLARQLIESGADPSVPNELDGETALHQAAAHAFAGPEAESLIRLLVNLGIDINARSVVPPWVTEKNRYVQGNKQDESDLMKKCAATLRCTAR